MGAIKITPADGWFSKCVRLRADYKCQRCQAQHDQFSRGLHCSHIHGRGAWSVRLDPENALALCYGCHQFVGSRPQEHTVLAKEHLGIERYDALLTRKNNLALGRIYRKTKGKGEISKFYKNEFERMQREVSREFSRWIN